MLGNLQYTAFYKFLVSLGVAFVALAAILPWLLLTTSFDLHLKQDELAQLTPVAQQTIRHRQAVAASMSAVTPWLSIALFLAGMSLCIAGVLRWQKRQGIHDQTEEATLCKLHAETAQILQVLEITPREREARQSEEAWIAVR